MSSVMRMRETRGLIWIGAFWKEILTASSKG